MSRIVAIHQPNYLPWLGYFYKMLRCDIFVFLDNVPFPDRSYINRNLIKTPRGSQWLTVSVLTRGARGQLINEVLIDNKMDWNEEHWKTLIFNYKRAPYFKVYEHGIKALYDRRWEKLTDLNEALIEFCRKALKITHVDIIKASSLNVSGRQTDLLIDICQKTGADTCLSGYGSTNYIEEDKFKKAGINLKFYDFKYPVYNQLWGGFIPNLCILDLLFNEGEKSISILEGAHI